MTEIIRHCPHCGWDRQFAQHHPAAGCCPDTTDGYCSEWFCLVCGGVAILGGVPAPFERPESAFLRDRVA
jgi:hypothetical protein